MRFCVALKKIKLSTDFINNATRCLASKSYYDSQSGTHMQIPGSGEFQIHDVVMKSTTLKNNAQQFQLDAYLQYCSQHNINSISIASQNSRHLPFNASAASIVFSLNDSFDSTAIVSGVEKSHLELETNCDAFISQSKNGVHAVTKLDQVRKFGLPLRVNLYLDVSQFLCGGQEGYPKTAPPIMSVMSTVGNLCDINDVRVINLVLSASVSQRNISAEPIADDFSDDLTDYMREVLEECIGLDVAGTAAIDRLSIQAASNSVLEMAIGLGIRRFAVMGDSEIVNSTLLNGSGASLSNEDDSIDIVIDRPAAANGNKSSSLYCLTPTLSAVLPLLHDK